MANNDPTFFQRVRDAITFSPGGFSSERGRNSERLQLGLVAAESLYINRFDLPILNIGVNTAQFSVSLWTMFCSNIKFCERLVHMAQAGLSGTMLGIEIYLFVTSTDCTINSTVAMCMTNEVLKQIYGGLVLLTSGAGEVSKADETNEVEEDEQELDNVVHAV